MCAPSPFDFVGRMTAVVAILPVASEAARAMLPAGLDLAPQNATPGDRHPLVLIMGHQRNVRPRLVPFGADYHEFLLVLPHVALRAERGRVSGPFCHPLRLYLDRSLPTLAGRLLYAYDKRRAAIRMTAESYKIAETAGAEPLLEAHFGTAGPAIGPCRSDVARLFDLPVISQATRGWRYSVADFGLDRALLQPIALDLVIHRPFVTGLPVGEFRFTGGEGDAARAFRVRTDWRLAGPWARPAPLASGD